MNSDNFPSLGALLGLVAVAGWQNRDKISEFVQGLGGGSNPAAQAIPGGLGGALGGLVEQMTKGGSGNVVDSWVGTGQNIPINGGQLSQALGPDLVSKITQATGLTPEQVLAQLSQVLPQVVDGLTPKGQLPR